MRALLAVVLALLVAAACHDHGHGHGHGHEHGHGHGHEDHGRGHGDHAGGHGHGHGHGEAATAITHFSGGTELFVEIPPLVTGKSVEPAAHVTRLSDWQPAREGVLTVRLSGGGAPEESFSAQGPADPGIFRPVVTPAHAGKRTVTVTVDLNGQLYQHPCGELEVHPSEAAAEEASEDANQEEDDPNAISFLKEQAWKIEFAMAKVTERSVRPSFEEYGTLKARSDGEAHVTAPVSGRLAAGKGFPRIGLKVKAGDVLAVLTPRLAEAGDSAALAQAIAQAAIALRKAEQERKRLDKLFSSGAVAERRLVDAKYAEEQARQALTTAQRRQRQAQRFSSAGGSGEGAVRLRAPMSGTVVSVETAPGAFVEQGDHLIRIVDLQTLWLEVHVVETHAALLHDPRGVWFEVAGFDEPWNVGPEGVITAGGELDPRSRTLPLIVSVDNSDRRLRVGMFADVRVITGPPKELPTIPVSAILWESGLPVVYTQIGGESFARRPVKLGWRDGAHIAVLDGIKTGEWVVSQGAYAVRLAGAAPPVAGHGHPH